LSSFSCKSPLHYIRRGVAPLHGRFHLAL
jgi:hypothetical protein